MSRPRAKKGVASQLVWYAHDQLAFWEALRRFGFSADDIYAAFYNADELFTTLKVGDKEWNVSISQGRKVPTDEYVRIYTKKCEWWNTAPNAEKRVVFERHMPVEKMTSIAMSLREKDIVIPKMPDAPDADTMALARELFGREAATVN